MKPTFVWTGPLNYCSNPDCLHMYDYAFIYLYLYSWRMLFLSKIQIFKKKDSLIRTIALSSALYLQTFTHFSRNFSQLKHL